MNHNTGYKAFVFFSLLVTSCNSLLGMESVAPTVQQDAWLAQHNATIAQAEHLSNEIAHDIDLLSSPLENIQIYAILEGVAGELSTISAHHSGFMYAIQETVTHKCKTHGWFKCQICAKEGKPHALFPLIDTRDILLHNNQFICNSCAFRQHMQRATLKTTPLCPFLHHKACFCIRGTSKTTRLCTFAQHSEARTSRAQ